MVQLAEINSVYTFICQKSDSADFSLSPDQKVKKRGPCAEGVLAGQDWLFGFFRLRRFTNRYKRNVQLFKTICKLSLIVRNFRGARAT